MPIKAVQGRSRVDWRSRLLTAAIAIPTLVAAISLPEPVFSITIVIAVCIGYNEVSSLLKYSLIINYPLFVLIYLTDIHPLLLFSGSLINLFVPLWMRGPIDGLKLGLVNILFIHIFAAPMMYGSRLRNLPVLGWTLSITWLLVSFASDAGALTMGSLIGKHKCCPLISPKKTWEGLLGAVVGGVAAAIGLFIISIDTSGEISIMDFIAFGLIESFFGMIGDLIESGLKRYVSAKDSSDLLPGHGGLLDRLDALAASVPFVYYYCKEIRGW
jgi:phosphatidate cytidylyltransferase